jgi:long-chain acyl-CoA synthetase
MSRRIKSQNIALLYQQAAEKFEALPAFAIRKNALQWNPVSYRELYEQGLNLATGLIELGVKARDHVGLFGDNRFEWILSDCGVQICGAADVPRGRDVSDDELSFIIEHSGMEVTFVETETLMIRVQSLKSNFPALREIILLDPNGTVKHGALKLADVVEKGRILREKGDRRAEERIAGIQSDDLFTLIYTSGTTGIPKGVMLTHSNMVSQIRNLPGIHNCTDRVLSVLPIWHIFERVMEMYTMSFGGCTYYSSILTLGDDMRNVEPTFMASAPRLWEKLHERIIKNIKSSHPVRQILFHIAYFLSRQYKESEYFITNKKLKMKFQPWWKTALLYPFHIVRWAIVMPWYGFFNAAVLERIRLGAGGSLKTTISGGGALPSHIDKFFNYVGIPVLEGYGMTETSPVISVRSMINLVVGTVGPPIPETEIRIVDPETGVILYPNNKLPHNGLSQRGEIWVRGPQVMKGYYKDLQLTDQTIKDGWLRTGDLGAITHNNCLKILGRCKATIVLSSGENVEPEPIEMRLQQSQFIDHCMIIGQDKKFLSALIVPVLTEFKQAGFTEETAEALSVNPDAQKVIREEIRKMTNASNGFKKYEQIRDFRLLHDSFQVGNELTNLYKIKRHVVEKKYNHVILEIFSNESVNNN